MIDEHGYQKTHYDSCDEYSHEILQRKSVEKRFEIPIFPEISSQKSQQSDDDEFFPHPDDLPECSVQTEFVGDQRLEKELEQQSDEEYFGYKSKYLDRLI